MLLHIYISIVQLKFGVDIQSQTKVRVWKPKNPIWPPGGHFERDVTKNNTLLHIYITIVPLKFAVDIQSQTKVRVRKPKIPIWLLGGHFEINVAENQYAPTHIHKYCAT